MILSRPEPTIFFFFLAKNISYLSSIKILFKQVFHPQGGGQPTDIGTITVGESTFAVEHVAMRSRESGIIEHAGKFVAGGVFSVGDTAVLAIDGENRKLCARLHSAGHLLDAAMKAAGRTDLEPSKGYHFSKGAYVEYIGTVRSPHVRARACAYLCRWKNLSPNYHTPVSACQKSPYLAFSLSLSLSLCLSRPRSLARSPFPLSRAPSLRNEGFILSLSFDVAFIIHHLYHIYHLSCVAG